MKVCLISVEIFAWGKHGGFGRATRLIGRELVKRGIQVFAVVPRRRGQRPVENLDGITVLSFPPYLPWTAVRLFRESDADIFHSCEPSLGTHLAMKTMPDRNHIVTFRDPRDMTDWKMEFDLPSLSKIQVLHNFLYESNPFVRRAVRRMDGVYTTARYLIPKVKRMYGLESDPVFLPTPVPIPDRIEKAAVPTVCYLARLDRRKRPSLFLDLAEHFPDVRFIAMGKSRDRDWEASLRRRYAGIKNIEFAGFVDQFESERHAKILEKSWVMVNCATREALPNAFLEAASYQCAILSAVDPDGFASRFGYHAKDDDFAAGLEFLLRDRNWEDRGLRGYDTVKQTFELKHVIDLHLEIYEKLLSDPA